MRFFYKNNLAGSGIDQAKHASKLVGKGGKI